MEKVLLKYTVFLLLLCSFVLALPPKKVFVATGAAEHGSLSGTAKPLFSIGLGPFSLQLGVQPWGQLPAGQMTQAGVTVHKNITLPALTVLVPNAVLNVSGLQQPAQPPVWVVLPNGATPMPIPPVPMPMPVPPNGGIVSPAPLPPAPAPLPPVPAPMPSPFPWETTTSAFIPQPPGSTDQQPGDQGGYIITETVDSMGNVVQTITPIGSATVDGQSGQQTGQSGQTVLVPGMSQVVEEIIEILPGTPSQPGQAGLFRRGVVTRLTGAVIQRNNTKPILNFIKGQ